MDFTYVGCTLATFPAFKENTEYVYLVNGRTLTGLHEVADQYSGIFIKGKLHIYLRTDGKLQGQISDAQYAQIHSELPGGWKSFVPESQLTYKPLSLSEKPFQIELQDGILHNVIVEKDMTNWEANFVKSIMSQFQLDVQGKRAVYNPINTFPSEGRNDGVFKTLEETITGETVTSYEIHPLPEYQLQSEPWLAPQLNLKGDGEIMEVVKNKNYSEAYDRPSYHYGFGSIDEAEPTSNRIGQFFVRNAKTRAILTGKLSRFTVQSVLTVNKILVNPVWDNKEKGSVISMVNLTLDKVQNQGQQPPELSSPVSIGNLVYSYESPFADADHVSGGQKRRHLSKLESSEESGEQTWGRFRRSARQMIEKLYKSDQQSSEEYVQQQPQPGMNTAPELPLLPYFMGYHGKSIKQSGSFDLKQNVQKIAQEIGQDIQEPEKILTEATLSKFTILCSLIRLMDTAELNSVAQALYTQSKQGPQRDAWIAFRDAVSETGTGPAFSTIQEWIKSKKIEYEEAAEIVSTMAYSVRTPTEEYMRKFFELVQDPVVSSQNHLNESALLSFTDLVNRVYVNSNQSHSQYPVHSFGTFNTAQGRKFMKDEVIPYVSSCLDRSIQEADSSKIHVYIRALGNIGHRNILSSFEKYLEGEQKCSQFQRMMMVVSLDKLVESYPVTARSVLYKIYQNPSEIQEIRASAVYQLIRTVPPAEMLQSMAEYTNIDKQELVNGAVKSAIETACQLRSPRLQKLRHAAESARPLLTSKVYGIENYNGWKDYVHEKMQQEYVHHVYHIGSEESYLPKSLKYQVKGRINGMNEHFVNVQAMVSSIKELKNVLFQQTEQYEQLKSQRSQQGGQNKWSSENVARMLNLETPEKEQLEGFIYTQMGSLHKLWSIDNNTLERLPEQIRQLEESLKNGKQQRYTKLGNLKELAISFPTEMGLPFLYAYDMPVVLNVQANIKAAASPSFSQNNKLEMPETITAEVNSNMIVSGKVQSHLSFVTPFDHQQYISGFNRNLHFNIPVNAKIEIDVKNMQSKWEIDPSKVKGERLLHYSAWPFTSRSDVMTITPTALRPNTQVITQNNQRQYDKIFGEKNTGLAFRLWGHHHEQSLNLLELMRVWKSENIITAWEQLWDNACMHQSEFSVAFVPGQSTTRKITLRLGLQKAYKKQPEMPQRAGFITLDQLNQIKAEPMERQKQIMKHVGSGINSAYLRAYDMLVEFEGDRQRQHSLTLGLAKSNVDPKHYGLVYYKNNVRDEPVQLAAQIQGEIPNTNGLDLTYALKTEPSAKFNYLISYGPSESKSMKVQGKITMRRSSERKEYLLSQPLYQVCKQEMQEGNRNLPACANLTIQANFFDRMEVQMKPENWDEKITRPIKDVYRGIRLFFYPMTQFESAQSQDQQYLAEVRFQPNLKYLNISVTGEHEKATISDIPMNEWAQTIVVPHPVFHLRSRMFGKAVGFKNFRPTCVVDHTATQTFNNKTYPISLGSDWTVMMQYVPQQARRLGQQSTQSNAEQQLKEQMENFVVLVREQSEHKELKIVINSPQTEEKQVEIAMQPTEGQGEFSGSNPAATVLVDGQKVTINDKQSTDLNEGYIQIYALPNGEVKVEIQDTFYVIYDGERVRITTVNDKLGNDIVGLCGRFNADQFEDFLTPSNCVAKDVQKFIQSYKIGQNQQRLGASQECVQKVLPLYVNYISEIDSGKQSLDQSRKGSSGTRLQHRYVEENGSLCFTTRAVPVCKHRVRSTISKDIPVVCIDKTKAAYLFKKQIDAGGNPDFSHKQPTKTVKMDVAQRCY
ncbi:vitellogenin-like isoform X2 [Cylas formicarius]|uniref:vitellogenin-like isoform X2 n=1 Tax=Cylas formicarius TaxID=197179 RepID=UPI002958762F|nr:vitellogenin-like isoform X2 [Cylas formicarius]